MYYRYPIERIARSPQTRFQRGFAVMAMYLLPNFDDVLYEPTELGLKILGSEESALAAPCDMLHQIYGEEVRLSRPRVRLVRDAEGVKEPVMNLRVSAPPATKAAILDDLARRAALVQETDDQQAAVVIRAQARLRDLLGYRQSLATMTGNRADLWMWLSHYDPVGPPPGGAAA